MTEPAPTVSVIVPVYNSKEKLGKALAALADSTYSDFEVLVVDDGSTELIEPIVTQHGFTYLRIDGPGGPARARNRGARNARGKYLVFVDADVCVHRDTLQRFVDRFAADPATDAVIGSYDDSPADPGFLSQYKNLFHHYVHNCSDGPITTFWCGCGAIRRELFLSFGGFDETRYRRPAIEDIELGTWLTAAGHKIVLDSGIKGKHLKQWTFWNLLKTDVWDRGVPWTRLMLRAGAMVNSLNVKPVQRLSVALSYLALLGAMLAYWVPAAWLAVAALVLMVTFLNRDFYRFFSRHSGAWFATRVAPLHWLYFWYCGFSFVFGTLLHLLESARSPSRTPARPVGSG